MGLNQKKFTFSLCFVFKGYCRFPKIVLINFGIRKYWEFQEKRLSALCYNHYIEDIRKTSENRYEVSLPFKENYPLIHNHFELSEKRPLNVYKRFKDDKKFLKEYDNKLKEQL